MDLIILAGGYAKRLGDATQLTPKIMLEFKRRTFFDYQLETVVNYYDNIIYSLGHLAQPIISAIESNYYKEKLSYIIDETEGCGTGAAILNCFPKVSENFAVMYGDSFLLCNHQSVKTEFLKSEKSCAMVLCKAEGYDENNVYYADGEVKMYDKTRSESKLNYLDYGLNFFSKKSFLGLEEKEEFDLAVVHQANIRQSQLIGIPVSEPYYEIGSVVGQRDFLNYLKHKFAGN